MNDGEILTHIFNNCDPILPADARFYIDCFDVRGGDAFADDFCKELSESQGRVYQIFAGHIGGGKSSELKHLAAHMNAENPSGTRKRFLPIIINILEYVEENNAAIEYILLGVVAATAQYLRDAHIADLTNKPLPGFLGEIKNVLQTPFS